MLPQSKSGIWKTSSQSADTEVATSIKVAANMVFMTKSPGLLVKKLFILNIDNLNENKYQLLCGIIYTPYMPYYKKDRPLGGSAKWVKWQSFMPGVGEITVNDHAADSGSSIQDLLSKVSRYEALFELAGVINAATDIESVGEVLAHRLKFIADVYSWRYICIDGEPEGAEELQPPAIIIDGLRGRADVTRTVSAALSGFELKLWRDRKTSLLFGKPMEDALEQLPIHLQKDDLEQISVNVLVENGKTRALYLFSKRRRPFTDLDIKCLSMVCGFFHRKVHTLWEQQKLRDLEVAYLEQEVMLRQNERLATLGRLSAGMAHELNNPASAVRQGSEQLRSSIARLEHARVMLVAADLSGKQRDLIVGIEKEAEHLAKNPSPLNPVARSDREQKVQDWLERRGIEEPWEHASSLVAMGQNINELEALSESFDPSVMGIVVDDVSSHFTTYTLLEGIGRGGRQITEIVNALKGYSFMDQAPKQAIDVRNGLNETLVILGSKFHDGVNVNLDFAEDLPRVQGYGSELNQVWTNLVDNAIGAMGGKGELELKTYQNDNWIIVEVADTGPGIPIEAQEKIFDPFYTTKAPGEGAGLGLNISHSIIVGKHKGQISVDSKPGATRFTVKLPITDETSNMAEERGNHEA